MTAGRFSSLVLTLAAIAGVEAGVRAQQAAASAGVDVVLAPVELDGIELFRVRGVSSLPADERARRIRDQVVAVAADRAISPESLRIATDTDTTRLLAGDVTVMTIVDADADLEQIGRAELAGAHLDRLRRASTEYRRARAPDALRRSVLTALGATAAFALSIVVLVRIGRMADPLLAARLKSRIHSVGIQSFEVMRADRIWSAAIGSVRALRLALLFAIALIYLHFVLALFPWTRAASIGLASMATAPLRVIGHGLLASIPNLVFLAVLFAIVRLALNVLRLFFDAVRRGAVRLERFDPDWAEPTYKPVRLGVVAFALVVAYPYIPGSDTAAFQGVSLFIGVVFSLGSSASLANIIAGYMMTYRRALRVGDRVRIDDVVGDVIEMRLQVTHLRSFKNEEIILPNSQILNGEVLNYSSLARVHGLILHTDVGIGYDTPWRQVEPCS